MPQLKNKIHPIHLRTEVLHTFEVRKNLKSKWIKVKPKLITGRKKKFVFMGKYGERKYGFRADKNLYLTSKRSFKFIRIDGQEVIKVGRKRKGIYKKKLQSVFNREALRELNPVLERIFEVRKWAAGKGLTVGGFPLPQEKVVRKLSKKASPSGSLRMNLVDVIEGKQYELRRDYLLEMGIGELWGDSYDGQTEGELFVAFFTTNPFREYKGEGPRFYVGKKSFNLPDAGIDRLEGIENLEALNSFVFDTYGELAGNEQPLFPLGIVGVRYVE